MKSKQFIILLCLNYQNIFVSVASSQPKNIDVQQIARCLDLSRIVILNQAGPGGGASAGNQHRKIHQYGTLTSNQVARCLDLSRAVFLNPAGPGGGALSGNQADIQRQHNSVTFKDLQVLQQKNGADCGFHALKNAWVGVLGDDLGMEKKYSRHLKTERFYNHLVQKLWKTFIDTIMQNRTQEEIIQFGNGWLSGGEIERIKNQTKSMKNLRIVVVDEREKGDEPFRDVFLRTIKNFLEQEEAKLGMVWNVHGQGRHWVAYVAVKQDRSIIIYHMDSMGGNMNTHDQRIIRNLFESSPEEIQRRIDRIERSGKLNTMKSHLNRFALYLEIVNNSYDHLLDNGIYPRRWSVALNDGTRYNVSIDQSDQAAWRVSGEKESFVMRPSDILGDMYRYCIRSDIYRLNWPKDIQQKVANLFLDCFQIQDQRIQASMRTKLEIIHVNSETITSKLKALPREELFIILRWFSSF